MKRLLHTGTKVVLLMLILNSCDIDKGLRNHTDIPHYINFYNATSWRPYLLTKAPQDSARHATLMSLSEHIGNFGRDLMDFSGGMTSEGYLVNYHTRVNIGEDKLNVFFDKLTVELRHLEVVSQGSDAQREFYKTIEFSFFNELEGDLSRLNIERSNYGDVATKLFIFENLCFYQMVEGIICVPAPTPHLGVE